jgi:hypothetical protein
MPIVSAVLGRKNQMHDQRQQGKQHEIKKFGFVCHKNLPLLKQRYGYCPYDLTGANVVPPFRKENVFDRVL